MNDLIMNNGDCLSELKGKSAAHITHFLKNKGGKNGTMADGVINMIIDFLEEKEREIKLAKRNYGVGGFVAGTIIIGGIWAYSYKKNEKKHQDECEEMAKKFERELAQIKAEFKNENLQSESGIDEKGEN